MISLDINQTSTSSPSKTKSSDSKTDTKLSFSDLLKGYGKDDNMIGDDVLSTKDTKISKDVELVEQNIKNELPTEETSKNLSSKDNLLTLLKNVTTTNEPNIELIDKSESNLKQTTQTSKTDIKMLVSDAKEYLKNQIVQTDGYKKAEVKELPKTLKGLVDLAEKYDVNVSKITIEDVKSSKKESIPTSTKSSIDLVKPQDTTTRLSTLELISRDKPINKDQPKTINSLEDMLKIPTKSSSEKIEDSGVKKEIKQPKADSLPKRDVEVKPEMSIKQPQNKINNTKLVDNNKTKTTKEINQPQQDNIKKDSNVEIKLKSELKQPQMDDKKVIDNKSVDVSKEFEQAKQPYKKDDIKLVNNNKTKTTKEINQPQQDNIKKDSNVEIKLKSELKQPQMDDKKVIDNKSVDVSKEFEQAKQPYKKDDIKLVDNHKIETKQDSKVKIKSQKIEKQVESEADDKKVVDTKSIEVKDDIKIIKDTTKKDSKIEIKSENLMKQQVENPKEMGLNDKTQKVKTTQTLESLLRGDSKVVTNSTIVNTNISSSTANLVTPPQSDLTKGLESLLQTDKTDDTQLSKLDGLSTNKADSFEVKVNESKQMIRYLSSDVKTAIDDYKSPFTRIKLQLNPQKLGDVEVTMVQRGSDLHVSIGSNSAAINTLAMNINELRVQLSNSGINNATLNFNNTTQNGDTGSGGQSGNNQHEQQRAHKEYNYFDNQKESNEEIVSSLEIVVPNYA